MTDWKKPVTDDDSALVKVHRPGDPDYPTLDGIWDDPPYTMVSDLSPEEQAELGIGIRQRQRPQVKAKEWMSLEPELEEIVIGPATPPEMTHPTAQLTTPSAVRRRGLDQAVVLAQMIVVNAERSLDELDVYDSNAPGGGLDSKLLVAAREYLDHLLELQGREERKAGT